MFSGGVGDEKNDETSPFTHTQLSLATFKGGNVVTEKGEYDDGKIKRSDI